MVERRSYLEVEETAAGRGRKRWLAWTRDLSVSVLLALVVILFVYQPVRVEGTSMMPSIADEERIFINKFSYRLGLGEIARGDLVVFWVPGEPAKSYIKRVVGLPGDIIEIRDGTVYVNGHPLREDYVPPEYRTRESIPPLRVPAGQYYVLGDHRSASNDSRHWGTISRCQILGKAVFAYWPLDRIGPLR